MEHVHKFVCIECFEEQPAAKAKASARPATPRKTSGKIKHAGRETFAQQHAGPYCYCRECVPIRKDEARAIETARIAAGTLSPTWKTDRTWNGFDANVLESPDTIVTRLSQCACGHRAGSHEKDKLDNLLKCEYSQCDCDHFHYEVKQAA